MMIKYACLTTAIGLLCGGGLFQDALAADNSVRKPSATEVRQSDAAERRALVYQIVNKWGPYVHKVHGEDIRQWADRLVPTLRQANNAKLREAADALTFTSVMNALTAQKEPTTADLPGGVAPNSIGSTTHDLVFTPLSSCNLVDTRLAGGAFTAAVPRHFKASGANFTGQGGSGTNCGIPANPTALLLGVTAVDPTSKGYFKLWPYSTPQPVSSSMSYGPTQNSRNDIVLKVSQGLSFDFTAMSSTSGGHILISVLGYYMAPFATTLDCETVTASVGVPALGFDTVTVDCPVQLGVIGSAVTGGGCANGSSANTNVSQSRPDSNGWLCGMRNNHPSSPITLTAYARCCRVPGRDPGFIIIPFEN